jgi:hypothetical protein
VGTSKFRRGIDIELCARRDLTGAQSFGISRAGDVTRLVDRRSEGLPNGITGSGKNQLFELSGASKVVGNTLA